MLVLTRKPGQKLTINTTSDGPIDVIIAGYDLQGHVKVGIEAPKNVSIVRSEAVKKQ